jgi:hypothetical protein
MYTLSSETEIVFHNYKQEAVNLLFYNKVQTCPFMLTDMYNITVSFEYTSYIDVRV